MYKLMSHFYAMPLSSFSPNRMTAILYTVYTVPTFLVDFGSLSQIIRCFFACLTCLVSGKLLGESHQISSVKRDHEPAPHFSRQEWIAWLQGTVSRD